MSNYNELEEFKSKIHEADIVSFDIFDTLLLRNVLKPDDIFKIAEREYCVRTSSQIDFYGRRTEAGRFIKESSKKEEIIYEDIYKYVESKIGDSAHEFKKIEIETEKRFLIANDKMKEAFELAKRLNKKVYVISDMYLPGVIIEEILKEKGYSGYDKLFVSSDLMVTKDSGDIYKHIRKSENIDDNAKWIHIGDNYKSDVINTKANNIQGFYYKRLIDRETISDINSLKDSIARAIQINNKYLNKCDNFGISLEEIG